MAKRKHSESQTAESPAHGPVAGEAAAGEAVGHGHEDLSAGKLGGLGDEVQAFLDRRAELASKLTLEIELTEKKLAELKRTKALLFPENAANGHAETERQERKPRKANWGKTARSQQDQAADHPQPSAEAVNAAEPTLPPSPTDEGAARHETTESNHHPG